MLRERELSAEPRTKFYLVNLPPTASLRQGAARVSAMGDRAAVPGAQRRTRPDHFEGRSLPVWEKHVLRTALAYAWLQHERGRRGTRLPSLPVTRAVITEILTAHFFVTHPHHLDTMLTLRDVQLQI